MHATKRVRPLLGIALAVAGLVLAACGGGDAGIEGRARPLGATTPGDGAAIRWSPSPVAFSINPGGRQDVPATFTSSADLTNVSVQVVPELRNIVTVSPTSFAALTPGQTATVTVTVAPSVSETYRTVEGTIHLLVGTSTVAKPLPVSISLVAPETINGVSVPPEPPPALNNATLAGFDTNVNGVRDDVERVISRSFGPSAVKHEAVLSFARAEQAVIASPTPTIIDEHGRVIVCLLFRGQASASELDVATAAALNTKSRRNAYAINLAGAKNGGCN